MPLERFDESARPLDSLRTWRERLLRDVHLRRVNTLLAGEAHTSAFLRLNSQAFKIFTFWMFFLIDFELN